MSTHDTAEFRVIEYREPDDTRVIAALHRTPETDAMTDDELIAQWQEWRQSRKLRAVVDD